MATYNELVELVKSINPSTELELVVDGNTIVKKGSALKSYLMTFYTRPGSIQIEQIETKEISKPIKIKKDGESL